MNVRQAGDFDYDAAGGGYAVLRRTDPRIAALVHAALGRQDHLHRVNRRRAADRVAVRGADRALHPRTGG
jgi:hypothetical protein